MHVYLQKDAIEVKQWGEFVGCPTYIRAAHNLVLTLEN
jgi:hypothetical protein